MPTLLHLAVLAPIVTGLTSPVEAVSPAKDGSTLQTLDKHRALLLWQMTTRLRLDPSVAPIVFEALLRHDRALRAIRRQQRRLLERVRAAVRGPAADATLLDLVDRSIQLRRKGIEARQARWKELRALLTSVQQAQFLLTRPHEGPLR
jgi:hypothetical protein